jgi:hypothetical protein
MVALAPLPTLFALYRRHRAGVVPALAPVLLVCGVSGVLAAVVAAEILAFRGLAPAPHVLAVHADPPTPVRFAEDRMQLGAECTASCALTSRAMPRRRLLSAARPHVRPKRGAGPMRPVSGMAQVVGASIYFCSSSASNPKTTTSAALCSSRSPDHP